MKISDIIFELETNYVREDDVLLIEEFVKLNGFNSEKVDQELIRLGYDPIFADLDEDGYETIQKIQPKKHLVE